MHREEPGVWVRIPPRPPPHCTGRYRCNCGVLAGESWRAGCILLIAAMGEALDEDERAIFRRLMGRAVEPGECVEELGAVVGRRGGKSRAIAVLVVYIAAFVDHRGSCRRRAACRVLPCAKPKTGGRRARLRRRGHSRIRAVVETPSCQMRLCTVPRHSQYRFHAKATGSDSTYFPATIALERLRQARRRRDNWSRFRTASGPRRH
jgi:hypothetical protein